MRRDSHTITCCRQLSTWTLGLYWLLMFTMTHLPAEKVQIPQGSDKHLHLAGFLTLGVLLTGRSWLHQPLTWRRAAGLWTIAALYAVVDELLQGPVGRQPDVLDALADMLGAALGILAAATTTRLLERHWLNRLVSNDHPANDDGG